jgi:hypothetical protein
MEDDRLPLVVILSEAKDLAPARHGQALRFAQGDSERRAMSGPRPPGFLRQDDVAPANRMTSVASAGATVVNGRVPVHVLLPEVLRKRPYIRREWCIHVIQHPVRRERQGDDRWRFWAPIADLGDRYLRVVTLDDGTTIRNTFPDRGFRP